MEGFCYIFKAHNYAPICKRLCSLGFPSDGVHYTDKSAMLCVCVCVSVPKVMDNESSDPSICST